VPCSSADDKPMLQKPRIIIAQVGGSGTALVKASEAEVKETPSGKGPKANVAVSLTSAYVVPGYI
jgi:hypothetical protein